MGECFLSLLIYAMICIFSYFIIKEQYLKQEQSKTKINYMSMLSVSILFTLYNVYLTKSHGILSLDRGNYLFEFQGYRYVKSIGLQWIFDIVHLIGGNIYTVFYLTTFLCVLLSLIAYKKADFADYRIFPLLMMSEWFFNTVTLLKQCYACAFAMLFFAYVLKPKTPKNIILSLIFAIVAFLFHTSGVILIPVFIAINFKQMKEWWTIVALLLLFIITFLLRPILLISSNVIADISPILAEKIIHYFIEGDTSGSAFSIVKWIPFYYIVFMGIIFKDTLKDKIFNYNKFLIVSAVAACMALFSANIYWFYRFLFLFYLPAFSYYIMMNSTLRKEENKLINNCVVYGVSGVVFVRWFILMYINCGGF